MSRAEVVAIARGEYPKDLDPFLDLVKISLWGIGACVWVEDPNVRRYRALTFQREEIFFSRGGHCRLMLETKSEIGSRVVKFLSGYCRMDCDRDWVAWSEISNKVEGKNLAVLLLKISSELFE